MVFLSQNIGQRPVPQATDVAEFTLTAEDFLRPFPGKAEGAGERAKQLDDLGDVVVVFAVFGARLRVKEVVTCD